MFLKRAFQIIATPEPITTPTSKFGGQPVWLNTPHWPLDAKGGKPMLFMGQIALEEALFPGAAGTVAYLFVGAQAQPLYHSAIGVVLQRQDGALVGTSAHDAEAWVQKATGPAIFELDAQRQPVYKEYKMVFGPLVEEAAVAVQERVGWDDLEVESGYHFTHPELAGNKIGGQPLYIEGKSVPHDYFTNDQWLHFLQLAPLQGYRNHRQPNFYPFYLDLGEFGLLNLFITKDLSQVRGYVQGPS